jgi:hypothetical protein
MTRFKTGRNECDLIDTSKFAGLLAEYLQAESLNHSSPGQRPGKTRPCNIFALKGQANSSKISLAGPFRAKCESATVSVGVAHG